MSLHEKIGIHHKKKYYPKREDKKQNRGERKDINDYDKLQIS